MGSTWPVRLRMSLFESLLAGRVTELGGQGIPWVLFDPRTPPQVVGDTVAEMFFADVTFRFEAAASKPSAKKALVAVRWLILGRPRFGLQILTYLAAFVAILLGFFWSIVDGPKRMFGIANNLSSEVVGLGHRRIQFTCFKRAIGLGI